MLKYGSDKPDLRNPVVIADVSEAFRGSGFGIFAKAVEAGSVVRAIPAPGDAAKPRSFFDKLNDWARGEGAAGLGHIIYRSEEHTSELQSLIRTSYAGLCEQKKDNNDV